MLTKIKAIDKKYRSQPQVALTKLKHLNIYLPDRINGEQFGQVKDLRAYWRHSFLWNSTHHNIGLATQDNLILNALSDEHDNHGESHWCAIDMDYDNNECYIDELTPTDIDFICLEIEKDY